MDRRDLHEVWAGSYDRNYRLHIGPQISEIDIRSCGMKGVYFLKSVMKAGKICPGCGFQGNFTLLPILKNRVGRLSNGLYIESDATILE